jgi:hypothetical protein
MPRMHAFKLLVAAMLLVPPWARCAEELTLDALSGNAYRTNPQLAAEADRSYGRALEIGESRFTKGTAQEFDESLQRAAILGHVGATDLMCSMRSNPMLGIAFFREGYAWCRIAKVYFRDDDAESERRSSENLAFVMRKLGKENLYLGVQYEQLTLRRMMEAARSTPEPPAKL